MSAKDGRSGSERKKGPPLVRPMAQREPCRRFHGPGGLTGAFLAALMLAIAVSELPHRYVIPNELTLRLRRCCTGRHGWAGGGLGGGAMGRRKSPGSPPYPWSGYRWCAAAMGLGSAISSWRPSRALPRHFAGVELATLAALGAYFLAGAIHRRPRGFASNAPAPGAEQAVGNLRQIV